MIKVTQLQMIPSLYANSIFLMANSAAGAALGFAFWVLAARLYPAEAVGLGSAVLSAAGLLAFIATMGFGDKLLLVFGQQYSQEGTRLLWLLSPSVLPLSLNVLYLAVARVRKKMREVVVITAAIAVSTLGLSYILLPRLGILAPGAAWLASQTLVALVLLPRFIRILRTTLPVGVER